MITPQQLSSLFSELNLEHQEFSHPPVFTCEESQRLCPEMPGLKNKNLFLRDRKGKQYFLISMSQDKQFSISDLADKIGEKNLSFASPERLKKTLGVEPGSVGILAVAHDSEVLTRVYIDADLLTEEWFQSHPGVNDATWCMKTADLPKFFQETGHQFQAVSLSP